MNAAKKLPDHSGEMSSQEAADYIARRLRRKFSRKTLYNYMSAGQGPACEIRLGENVFLAADLDAWLAKQTTKRRAFSR